MEILLYLQNFRESYGAIFTSFFEKMTYFGELNTVLVLLAIIYWCIDKETGVYLMTGWCWNRLLNGIIKVKACIYRPWILDSRIIPEESVMETATGYSFPSGHCVNATTIFGGISLSKYAKTSLRIFSAIFVILVAFSRIYFCVHTPNDIAIGVILAFLVMLFCRIVLEKTADKENADIVIAIISIVLSIITALYARYKSYPVDYDAEGKVIVDGIKMAADSFGAVGLNIGFFVGTIIEKRYVKFTSDGNIQKRAIHLISGLLGFYLIRFILSDFIQIFFDGIIARIIINCVIMLYITLIFPYIIKKILK